MYFLDARESLMVALIILMISSLAFGETDRKEGTIGSHKYIKVYARTEGGPRPLKLSFMWIQDGSTVYSFSSISEIDSKERIEQFFLSVIPK